MKSTVLFLAILLFGAKGFSQTSYSPETLQKIKEVENNITGNILFNDDKPSSITERMAKYNVKGMSIAVISDTKLYGQKDMAGQMKRKKNRLPPKLYLNRDQ